MEKLSLYNIAFKGLKEGNHLFDYPIGNSFFEHFENSFVEEADVKAEITLEKRNTFMSLVINLKGTVRLTCDRCLEEFDQPVSNQASLFIKFGDDKSEEGEDVIWIHPEEYQFNVAQIIYEYLILSIPLRHVHPLDNRGKSGCNPEMLKKLQELAPLREEKRDERWDQLKNLMNNN